MSDEVKAAIRKLMVAMGRADEEDIPLPCDLVEAIEKLFVLYSVAKEDTDNAD